MRSPDRISLERLLRLAAAKPSVESPPSGIDGVASRVALFAGLIRFAPPMRPGSSGWLLWNEKTGAVIAIPLRPAGLVIGRGPQCDVRLEGDEVSRRHSQVLVERRGVFIADIGSTNGTWVNDRRVRKAARLRDGDTIRIGETEMVFVER